ncbi:YkvA family protein [Alsobacter sp. KACC 23698]|uniref:YkvA family protein n=1 Tax=Alsobacter sp. KACC 23698 TaxID=3149229 RepID=A0AAU7JN28_9HYPH
MDAIRRAARDEKRVFADAWRLLKRVGKTIPFAEDVLAAYYCALDPSTERRVKLILVGALAYFVMPFDVLPDFMPLIGFTDDAAVIATAIASVSRAIKPEHREKAKAALQSDLGA